MNEIRHKIENFQDYFEEKYVAPEYSKAWELNKKHGIKLNHLPKESGLYLAKLVNENKSKTILEIGTSGGYSTLYLAEVAATYGGQVYTIEKSAPKAEIARVHFAQSKLENIHLIEDKAEIVLQNWDKPIDLLFLDADRKRYKEFLLTLLPHLSPTAIIAADNVNNFKEEVADFLEYLQKNPRFKTEILPLPNGLLISKLLAKSKENTDECEDDREEKC